MEGLTSWGISAGKAVFKYFSGSSDDNAAAARDDHALDPSLASVSELAATEANANASSCACGGNNCKNKNDNNACCQGESGSSCACQQISDDDDEEEMDNDDGSSSRASERRKGLSKEEYLAMKKKMVKEGAWKTRTRSHGKNVGFVEPEHPSSSSASSSAHAVKPRAAIYFATQSGTAELFARELYEEASEKGFDSSIMDLTLLDVPSILQNKFMVFVVPTWHEGKPPKSAQPLFDWCQKHIDEENKVLVGLKYVVLGLGNSEYGETNFNRAGIVLDQMLFTLGARRMFTLGCDDAAALKEGFLRWKEEMWTIVCPRFGLVNDRGPDDDGGKSEPEPMSSSDDDDDDEDRELLDVEDLGGGGGAAALSSRKSRTSGPPQPMLNDSLRKNLSKQGYKLVGSHSGVKFCRWTKSMLRGRGGCYKHTFYGISSYQCMESTPSLACANKCVFCWRHHSNPVGTTWRWQMDDPKVLVKGFIENHRKMVKEMRGLAGVIPERLAEAETVRHCALSLVGEPIMYPEINTFLTELHNEGISTFLVTNAQFPEQMQTLVPITQLYVSIDAPNAETLKKIDRPLFSDYWPRFLQCLEVLKEKQQRTVFRMTLVKDYNVADVAGYVELVHKGEPDFIEIKGVTFSGGKRNELGMKNVPWHAEVVEFGKLVEAQLDGEYLLASEHAHSCCILLAHKKFLIEGKWHTFIDFDKFIQLSLKGEKFTSMDYVAETPEWAVYGKGLPGDGGFDPAETHFRRGEGADTNRVVRGGGC